MATPRSSSPKSELSTALATLRGWWLGLFLFSGVINLLTLTGSIFMLQVYDRVLTSRSIPTLIALLVITIGLYALQSGLEIIRSRLLLRMGSHFEEMMGARIYGLVQLWPLRGTPLGDGLQPIRDLDGIRSFLSERGVAAILDLPWMPLFLVFVFLLHPWLGLLTLCGMAVLFGLAYASEILSRQPMRDAVAESSKRQSLSLAGRRNAEVLRAMGFGGRHAVIWLKSSAGCRNAQERAGDINASLGAMARMVRASLQAATLALGAWLVIQGEVSSGVLIASSITAARALAPIDQAIAYWKSFAAARDSHARLEEFLKAMPPEPARMSMPAPKRELKVETLQARAPGTKVSTVRGVSFRLAAGQGLGIIGPSGGGKSTLARAIVGVWPIVAGAVRLDGVPLSQWDLSELGRHIGYLPQDIELFAGTIAENIARFDENPTSEAIIKAAQAAGVHELILNLPKGYETQLGEDGAGLSGGQRQRIGLARALYGDPFLVVLDEPNANLDAEGEASVTRAIKGVRERGGIVIIVAHRPNVLAAVDVLARLEGGVLKAFGPKEEVLRKEAQASGAVPLKTAKPAAEAEAASGFARSAARSGASSEAPLRPANGFASPLGEGFARPRSAPPKTIDLKPISTSVPRRPTPALPSPRRDESASARPENGARRDPPPRPAASPSSTSSPGGRSWSDDPLSRLAQSFREEDEAQERPNSSAARGAARDGASEEPR